MISFSLIACGGSGNNGDDETTTDNLSGVVFADWNGNGLQDEGEPAIHGVVISVNSASDLSDEDGNYQINNVEFGDVEINIQSPADEYMLDENDNVLPAFRYWNKFIDWVIIESYEMDE